jgi:hypothetical protein
MAGSAVPVAEVAARLAADRGPTAQKPEGRCAQFPHKSTQRATRPATADATATTISVMAPSLHRPTARTVELPVLLDHPLDHPDDPTGSFWSRLDLADHGMRLQVPLLVGLVVDPLVPTKEPQESCRVCKLGRGL